MISISLMTILDEFCIIYKMSKPILNFNDIDVKKSTFHKFKYPTDINEVDSDKIVIS